MPRQKKKTMPKERSAYLKARATNQLAKTVTPEDSSDSSSSSSDAEEESSDSEEHSRCYKKLRYRCRSESSSSDEDVHVEGYRIIDVQCLQRSVAQAGVCSVCKVGKYYLALSHYHYVNVVCVYIYMCMCRIYVHIAEIFYSFLDLCRERYIR